MAGKAYQLTSQFGRLQKCPITLHAISSPKRSFSISKTKLGDSLLEEKVLYRTLKGSISATYLEPLKGYRLHSLKKGSSGFYIEPWGSILGQ